MTGADARERDTALLSAAQSLSTVTHLLDISCKNAEKTALNVELNSGQVDTEAKGSGTTERMSLGSAHLRGPAHLGHGGETQAQNESGGTHHGRATKVMCGGRIMCEYNLLIGIS